MKEYPVDTSNNFDLLNINQTPEELEDIHGAKDYYWYLRSPEFRKSFLEPIANIINKLGEPCLDVGCGEACLADYVEVPYTGFDGSLIAITRASLRVMGSSKSISHIRLYVDRFENPLTTGKFGTVVFGGIMEVLIKPDWRVPLLKTYQSTFDVNHFIIYDLERLDTTEIESVYGKPIEELHLTCNLLQIEEVKLKRKVLVYECQK